MTELSFLIDLLLNHDLPVKTKHAVAERIKEVEARLSAGIGTHGTHVYTAISNAPATPKLAQAPSTLALMAKHGDIPNIKAPEMPPIEPVAQVAQTPQAAAAMNSRNAAIADSIAGKVDKANGRPKKW